MFLDNKKQELRKTFKRNKQIGLGKIFGKIFIVVKEVAIKIHQGGYFWICFLKEKKSGFIF